ncbi:hypothetical protein HRI_005002600 [Hibiscus trionum]|uniref:Endonuclease/exonuclease/phosphatase domain-containing protein n=1 Tax=Hibiscus trionum TaxID=183268 RepID=A0A9W7JKB2_HIBTR|nr:hypothetical protein HRI_005002600 [Hibiscus trionum]
MRLLSWNIRGLGSRVKISEARRIVRENNIDIAFIQETKKEMISIELVRKFWADDNFDFRFVGSIGKSGGILTIWDKNKFEETSYTIKESFLFIEGKWMSTNLQIALANVYAPCSIHNQKLLWEEIRSQKIVSCVCWFLGGDFNAIRKLSERRSVSNSKACIKEFNSFIDDCKFFDLPLIGIKYTWYGPNNKRSRIDRIMVEEDWLFNNSDAHLKALPRTVSDHIPLLMTLEKIDWGPRPFKFINAWTNQEGYASIVN